LFKCAQSSALLCLRSYVGALLSGALLTGHPHFLPPPTPAYSLNRPVFEILESSLTQHFLSNLKTAAISRACLFHLRRIRQPRSIINPASLKTLIHCLILTRPG